MNIAGFDDSNAHSKTRLFKLLSITIMPSSIRYEPPKVYTEKIFASKHLLH